MDAFAFKKTATGMLEAILGIEPQEQESRARTSLSFDVRVPAVLRAFYEVASDSSNVMASHHRFVLAEDLVNEEALVFCEENERVVYWGIDNCHLDQDDPPVMQWNTTSEEWCEDCPSLSLFLLNVICWQLLNAARAIGGSHYEDGILSWTRKNLRAVSQESDRYDLMSFYGKGVAACFLTPKLFFVGCGSENRLAEFEQQIGMKLNRL